MGFNGNILYFHILDADIPSLFYRKNHLVYLILFSLNLHCDSIVPVILYPAGASEMIRDAFRARCAMSLRTRCARDSIPRAIAEPDPLHTTPEHNMLPDHLSISASLFPVSRYAIPAS